MGQIKNIKLHIVTDIKVRSNIKRSEMAVACNSLARKTMSYIFYCPSMKTVTKNLLHRSALCANNTLLHSDATSSSPISRNTEFPLNGNVGVDMEELERLEEKRDTKMLLQLGNDATRFEAVVQYLESMSVEASEDMMSHHVPTTPAPAAEETCIHINAEPSNKVECKIEACPPSLKRDFQRLFNKSDRDENLTVLTICQQAENDMTVWSDEVEEEREQLTKTFIHNAMEIVARVQEHGYWADFIDPCSG